MKTIISTTFVTDGNDNRPYFLLQVDAEELKDFVERHALFARFSKDKSPAYMTWFPESKGEWMGNLQLERYLDDLNLDSWAFLEKIDDIKIDFTVLPGEQKKIDISTYSTDDDIDNPNVDHRQTSVWGDGDFVFKCQFCDTETVIESRAISLNHIKDILNEGTSLITDPNLQFSRLYLSKVMIDVRKHVPKKVINTAWTHKSGNFREFQVPSCKIFTDGVSYHTRDYDLWWVRAKGWEQALSQLGVEGYAL